MAVTDILSTVDAEITRFQQARSLLAGSNKSTRGCKPPAVRRGLRRCNPGSCCSPWLALTPALPFCHAEFRGSRPRSEHYPKEINTLGDRIRTHRLDLKLLQTQVAEQIGVHEMTIVNWERNASAPAIRFIPAIIQFLGYDPLPPANSFPERLVTVRKVLGLSQREMAAKLGFDEATVRGWEAGEYRPTRKNLDLVESDLRSGCDDNEQLEEKR